jgi:hypothetical protein
MSRFKMIRCYVHVGVLDTYTMQVLELYTPDREKVEIRVINEADFCKKHRYQEIEPINAVDDDATVLERWTNIMNQYKISKANNENWEYDAGGEFYKQKLNCENVAEWVMTGISLAPLGIWSVWLKNYLGINVHDFRLGGGSFSSK